MRAACIVTLTVGLALAAPASAQFVYSAHGPRTVDTGETDRSAPARTSFHLLDPASGPPAPGFHLLDGPSVTPIAPANGWGEASEMASVGDRPTPRFRTYNTRPPAWATHQRSMQTEVQTVCLNEAGCRDR